MINITLSLEFEDNDIKQFAKDRGWKEKEIKFGVDSENLQTRTEVDNPVTYVDFSKESVEKLITAEMASYHVRRAQKEAEELIQQKTEEIYSSIKEQITVEIDQNNL